MGIRARGDIWYFAHAWFKQRKKSKSEHNRLSHTVPISMIHKERMGFLLNTKQCQTPFAYWCRHSKTELFLPRFPSVCACSASLLLDYRVIHHLETLVVLMWWLRFGDFFQLVGPFSRYLLPKQGNIPNWSQFNQGLEVMCHPVFTREMGP